MWPPNWLSLHGRHSWDLKGQVSQRDTLWVLNKGCWHSLALMRTDLTKLSSCIVSEGRALLALDTQHLACRHRILGSCTVAPSLQGSPDKRPSSIVTIQTDKQADLAHSIHIPRLLKIVRKGRFPTCHRESE